MFKNIFCDIFDYVLKISVDDIINNKYNFEIAKNKLIISFKLIFSYCMEDIKDNEEKKRLENISKYYYNNFINFINFLYPDSDKISQIFGEKIIENSLKLNYFGELVIKYLEFCRNRINNIICRMIYFIIDNEDILLYLQNQVEEKYNKDILPNIKTIYSKKLDIEENKFDEIIKTFNKKNKKSNPNIELLINICNHINKKEDFNLDTLDNIIKNYLFFIVWAYKGKIPNIHNDFGRISFLRINEIDSKYFCCDEDRIKCCQELIQRLIEIDEKHF
jgi:hypothetical protein